MRSTSLAGVVALIVLLIAACGGDSAEETWAKRADEACVATRDRLAGLPAPVSREQFVEFYGRGTREGRRLISELRAIEAPETIADDVRLMIAGYSRAVEIQARAVRAGGRNDRGAAERLIDEATRVGTAADRIALRLGADQCTRTPGAEPGD